LGSSPEQSSEAALRSKTMANGETREVMARESYPNTEKNAAKIWERFQIGPRGRVEAPETP
jgi:hypothetical protein